MLRAGGLNMTKIQSRPIKDRVGEYRFFIEVEGDYSLSGVRKVLTDKLPQRFASVLLKQQQVAADLPPQEENCKLRLQAFL